MSKGTWGARGIGSSTRRSYHRPPPGGSSGGPPAQDASRACRRSEHWRSAALRALALRALVAATPWRGLGGARRWIQPSVKKRRTEHEKGISLGPRPAAHRV